MMSASGNIKDKNVAQLIWQNATLAPLSIYRPSTFTRLAAASNQLANNNNINLRIIISFKFKFRNCKQKICILFRSESEGELYNITLWLGYLTLTTILDSRLIFKTSLYFDSLIAIWRPATQQAIEWLLYAISVVFKR